MKVQLFLILVAVVIVMGCSRTIDHSPTLMIQKPEVINELVSSSPPVLVKEPKARLGGIMASLPVAPKPVSTSLPNSEFEAPVSSLRSQRIIVTKASLFAVHEASHSVTRLALPSGERLWQTALGCQPATLSRLDKWVYVSCFDSGELLVMDETSGSIVARRWVGHGIFGVLAVSGRLFATLSHENALVVLDVTTLEEITRSNTRPNPRGLALGGERLYVVHLLDASLNVFNAEIVEWIGYIEIGQNAALAENVFLDVDRERAYVPHQRQNINNMARQFDNTIFPVVDSVDIVKMQPVRREALALDSVDEPVGLPMAVVRHPELALLYVVNGASDDLSVVDLDLGIGYGHLEVGHNPIDLDISPDGLRLYTLNRVSDDVTVVDTSNLEVIATFPLASDLRDQKIQRGERIFFTSRPDEIARDNWISCNSCHFNGGFDGQTWLGADEGARNTPILRGISGTEPFHWSADRKNIRAFNATIKELMGGTGLSVEQLDALEAYINNLVPLISPVRQTDGSLMPEAERGANIFMQAGCQVCHAGPVFTDQQVHNVGTGEPFHEHPSDGGVVLEHMGPVFDTPSLRELWHTSPFLHDGRSSNIRELLIIHNQFPDGSYSEIGSLSEEQISDLEFFLFSLPISEEEYKNLFHD